MSRLTTSLFVIGILMGWMAIVPATSGQDGDKLSGANWRNRDLWRDLWNASSRANDDAAARTARCRLFRMPSAFPENPISLGQDADSSGPDANSISSPDVDADSRLVAAFGNDNPFLDFRRPGDPGGVGFSRFYSQYLIVDNGSLGVSLGFQAVRPAGRESDGAAEGPTILSPNVALFYDLGDGTALHGFVGKNLNARSRWADDVENNIRYGVALQTPVPYLANNPGRGLHFFVEALGIYKFDAEQTTSPPNLEIIPGLHFKLNENWWMSGGFLLPVNAPRSDAKFWQLTCAWQF